MNLTTDVSYPSDFPKLSYRDSWLMLGSCFTENIGYKLQSAKFRCRLNPYGVLYNPFSIAAALEEIMAGKVYTSSDLFQYRGLWHSRMHHGSFSDADVSNCAQRINHEISAVRSILSGLDGLMLTWGSARVYESREDGAVVGNCHKLPERDFYRRRLSVEEIFERYVSLIEGLRTLSPSLKIILTVSPIRHIRDGLHENQLSKSVLLLAADALCRHFGPSVSYFPAYEIVMDELRDYRFYADDLVHPSSLAVEYIWNKFVRLTMDSSTQQLMGQCLKVQKSLAHRPLHPETEEYHDFLKNLESTIEQLIQKHPYIDLEKERELCHTLLNTSQR